MPSASDRTQADLESILANLGREIRRPLDLLRDEIGRMMDAPPRPLTDAEVGQARTMLTLCDDLGRLTRECLGSSDRTRG